MRKDNMRLASVIEQHRRFNTGDIANLLLRAPVHATIGRKPVVDP